MSFGSLPSRASVGVLALLAALALATSALAATPFSSTPGAITTLPTTTTQTTGTAAPVPLPPSANPGSGGISLIDEIAIAVVGIALFVAIISVIRRDAHVHAPRHATRDIDRERGTIAPRAERLKRSRAKAKAARRARRARR